jgi:hypothetical protein
MIGGPTDIVVEPNIVRATPARDQIAQRPGAGAEQAPRLPPLADSGWNEGDGARPDSRSSGFDQVEPQMPEPPPRPMRPSFADEVRRPMPGLSERRSDPLRSDPLAGFTPEPLGGRPEPRPELRPEPMPSRVTSRNEPLIPRPPRPSEAPKVPPVRAPERTAAPPPPPTSPALSAADQNLAEMAQRLEAALRRPAGDAAEPRVGAPPVAPEPPPSRGAPPRSEPSTAPPETAPSQKSGFENLEDEMASLLGRPKTPS